MTQSSDEWTYISYSSSVHLPHLAPHTFEGNECCLKLVITYKSTLHQFTVFRYVITQVQPGNKFNDKISINLLDIYSANISGELGSMAHQAKSVFNSKIDQAVL